jgi:glycosyltransferase involved in cell wall biosynthesis
MEQKKSFPLSVAIATYNEANNIRQCLASIADIASEIVIVDGSSTDATVSIVKTFGAKIIRTTNPAMFHINKQKALDACTKEWILQLDADEVVTSELKQEIIEAIERPGVENGYFIPRRNYFWGHFMKKGGQYPDYVIRLIRRGKARFPAKSVHEQIAVDGAVGHLTHPMLHYSYRTRQEYWDKANTYTTLTAKEFQKSNVGKTIGSWLLYMIGKPVFTFLSIFVRHKGFVDGITGFEFALYSGLHWAIAYKKYLSI